MKKSQKIYAGLILYAKDGSLMEFPSGMRDTNWRENTPFEAELTFQSFSRGRSAANAVYENAAGARFSMFLTDFADLVASGERLDVVKGTWVAAKRGQNYGIRRLEKE